ncbi:MAG: DEAD/DEAH box helicase, partial [Thermodesulfobacteriota bacterium]
MRAQSNPHFLSITEKTLLTPWFSSKNLDKGHEYTKNGEIREILYYRQGMGGLFQDKKNVKAACLIKPAPQLKQGFKLASASCDECGRCQRAGDFCSHIAAVILSLLEKNPADEWLPWPLPLSFADGPWQIIGNFLFNHFQRNKNKFSITADRVESRLSIPEKGLSLIIPNWAKRQAIALFPEIFKENNQTGNPDEPVKALLNHLEKVSRSNPEKKLNELGQQSRGQQRDCSFWLWLARTLHLLYQENYLFTARKEKSGLFCLYLRDNEFNRDLFSLTLPRLKTVDLLKPLAEHIKGVAFLPPARSYSRARFRKDSSLLVDHCLKLADGRIMTRTALEADRYRDHYYLDQEGFLPVRPQNKNSRINPISPGQPSLFATEETGGNLFTVSPDEIPGFIERFQQQLNSRENEVDPALLEMSWTDSPDHLKVLSCQKKEGWFYLAGCYGLGNQEISLTDLIRAREKKQMYLPGKTWFKLSGTPLEWFHALGKERLWHDKNNNPQGVCLTAQELLKLNTLVPSTRLALENEKEKQAARLLDPDSWQDPGALPEIPGHLRTYQKNGLAWLYQLYSNGLGAVLADDMGLGKTHQALGLVQILTRQQPESLIMIVAPASVVSHWLAKIETFYPELSVYLYYGNTREMPGPETRGIMLTTYGIMRRDHDILAKEHFQLIVFDEIQHLKNKKTEVYQSSQALKADIRIGLTGTPLENSLLDLKAIFDLCLPGSLGSDAYFRKYFVRPVTEHNSKERRRALGRMISPFILRRSRSQVLTELPDIIEDNRFCELSDDQVRLYRQAIGERGRELISRLEDRQNDRIPYMDILAVINHLKQICNHPVMLDKDTNYNRYASGKWELFTELLTQCLDASLKIVVFSQYTSMLDIIERYLKCNNINFCRLRGGMDL